MGRVRSLARAGWEQALAATAPIALCLAMLPGSAAAATIQVNTTFDEVENNAQCALREAVTAANTNADFGGCDGDTAGADTIVLEAGQTYTLIRHDVPDNTNLSGDLDITGGGGTTIRSGGPGLATIDADSTVFPGPADDTRGRAIDVISGAGGVTLEKIASRTER